jgi:glycosyltransferase involved in cell wall biosynthesis
MMSDTSSSAQISYPRLSVAICTYNRGDRLIYALDGLAAQSMSLDQFEILVVDNRSTDNTAEICRQYQRTLPNLRYVYEPVQGLSKARNTALHQVRADYIAYLDDDAIPSPTWVGAILNAFENVQPRPVCIGGPIHPLWDSPKPEWIPKKVEYLFSLVDYHCPSPWLKLPKYPFGANMAFQRQDLLQIGGFIECLGREGNQSLRSGEEYLVYRLLIERGKGLLYYEPDAPVQHWIPTSRIQLNWMLRRSYWQGRSSALISHLLGKPLLWEWKNILGGLFKHWRPFIQFWNIVRAWPDEQLRVLALVKTMQSLGYLHQVWLQSLTGKTTHSTPRLHNPASSISPPTLMQTSKP